MRQLFNKSGTVIVFFAATFFLCTFLISILFNTGSADVFNQFSENAVYAVITQDETKEEALSYSDFAAGLSSFPSARGAAFLELYDISGYMLFDNNKNGGFSGVFELVDTDTAEPQLILNPAYSPLCMTINGHSYLNLNGQKYRVIGNNIYTGMSGVVFYGNFAGIASSRTRFQGLSFIFDAGSDTAKLFNELKNKITNENGSAEVVSQNLNILKSENSGIGIDKLAVIAAVFMICMLLLVSAGVFAEVWVKSKISEIKARRICGASDKNIRLFIFGRYLFICIVGIAAGALFTVLSVTLTPIVYYLGSINIFAGAYTACLLTVFGGVSAYRYSAKWSAEPIQSLRRE